MFLIRFVFYFTLSFAILCIPIGDDQHLFDKLYHLATPYAEKAVKTTKQKLSSTKKYSRKLYSNSEPVEKDEVKSHASSVQKKKIVKLNQDPADTYTDEEQNRLRKVLSSKEE
jgi:hypothetical protein